MSSLAETIISQWILTIRLTRTENPLITLDERVKRTFSIKKDKRRSLFFSHLTNQTFTHLPCSGNCRFDAAVLPPVRLFLVVAVWAPSAFVLLGCYMYVYLVARAHARAIYTVELSFRHQTQTLALPRYGQTLALTVGAFLILWLPFQVSIADVCHGRIPDPRVV